MFFDHFHDNSFHESCLRFAATVKTYMKGIIARGHCKNNFCSFCSRFNIHEIKGQSKQNASPTKETHN